MNNWLIEKAILEDDSLIRLTYVAAYSAARCFTTSGRLQKPFNPLLGETYDLVTPTYRVVCEQVSHHPQISTLHCQGEGYTIQKTFIEQVKFTGKSITSNDDCKTYIKIYPQCLKGKSKDFEEYSFDNPKTVIGNLIIGDNYTEPQGVTEVLNHDTKESCTLEFRQRSWIYNTKDSIFAQIKDASGLIKYHMIGKYTDSFDIIDMDTNETWQVWKSPDQPQKLATMYGMNYYALQLNQISEQMRKKLPPTDSRLRQDIKLLEEGKQNQANEIKNELERY